MIERQGFFKGAQADTKKGKAMSPGTSASGGTRSGNDREDNRTIYVKQPKKKIITKKEDKPEETVKKPTKKKNRILNYLRKEIKKVPAATIKKKLGEMTIGSTATGFVPYMVGSGLYGLGKKLLNKEPIIKIDKTSSLDNKEKKLEEDQEQTEILKAANGGAIRKNFNIGSNGILDLEEADGEDISLTAELPSDQFNDEERLRIESEKEEGDDEDVKRIDLFASEDGEADPLNKLLMAEDGISTLFMKKGGRVPFRGGGRDASQADFGVSSNDKGETSSDSGWSPGAGSPGTTSTGGNVNTGSGSDQEEDVAQMMSDMNLTPDNAPDYTGSDYGFVVSEDDRTEKGGSDYIGPMDRLRINQDIIERKNKYDSITEKGKRAFNTFRSMPKPTGVPLIDIPRFAYFVFNQNKLKNARIAEIDADLELLDKIGATKFTQHTDTIYQTLEQEKLDLTQPRSQKDNEENGSTTVIEDIMASTETIKDRDETDIFDVWDRIKAGQEKRAMLVEKDIIQDNTQDETMMLNSGGLANLFRVKTQ